MRIARPLTVLAALSLGIGLLPAAAQAHGSHGGEHHEDAAYSFAVIGDLPYGADQIARFPGWIQQINADPAVRAVLHVGDIKNGSSVCSDDYFDLIRSDFDTFEDPLVYTPGDNEWTDCHRANNGAYDPLERLDKVREVFFDHPGRTLGRHPMRVDSQARAGFPENVSFRRADVTFVAANVVGSNNGLQPWTGLGNTEPTPEQQAAVRDRTANGIAALHQAFARARRAHDRGVVVMQQADMFDPTYTPAPDDISAFRPWVQALVDEARHFRGPVYLFDGDSHAYNADRPLATGSDWLTTYDVTGTADNLTRVTVDGSSNNTDYLRVSVNPRHDGDLLSWERVAYTG